MGTGTKFLSRCDISLPAPFSLQVADVAPSTFLNYCYVTSTEEYVKEVVVEEVLKAEGLVRVDVNAASEETQATMEEKAEAAALKQVETNVPMIE